MPLSEDYAAEALWTIEQTISNLTRAISIEEDSLNEDDEWTANMEKWDSVLDAIKKAKELFTT